MAKARKAKQQKSRRRQRKRMKEREKERKRKKGSKRKKKYVCFLRLTLVSFSSRDREKSKKSQSNIRDCWQGNEKNRCSLFGKQKKQRMASANFKERTEETANELPTKMIFPREARSRHYSASREGERGENEERKERGKQRKREEERKMRREKECLQQLLSFRSFFLFRGKRSFIIKAKDEASQQASFRSICRREKRKICKTKAFIQTNLRLIFIWGKNTCFGNCNVD